MQRQAGKNIEGLEVAERPEVAPHALLVQAPRQAAELLVPHLPRLAHEAELVGAVVVVVQALRLLPPRRGDLPALAPRASKVWSHGA